MATTHKPLAVAQTQFDDDFNPTASAPAPLSRNNDYGSTSLYNNFHKMKTTSSGLLPKYEPKTGVISFLILSVNRQRIFKFRLLTY
jgi:hypothetical protein